MGAGAITRGRRAGDDDWFDLAQADEIRPCDYGRVTYTNAPADWFVCCPDGSLVRLWVNDDDRNGNRHRIEEHDDGTISVHGSILGHDVQSQRIGGVGPISSGTWHGWLERGNWRSV